MAEKFVSHRSFQKEVLEEKDLMLSFDKYISGEVTERGRNNLVELAVRLVRGLAIHNDAFRKNLVKAEGEAGLTSIEVQKRYLILRLAFFFNPSNLDGIFAHLREMKNEKAGAGELLAYFNRCLVKFFYQEMGELANADHGPYKEFTAKLNKLLRSPGSVCAMQRGNKMNSFYFKASNAFSFSSGTRRVIESMKNLSDAQKVDLRFGQPLISSGQVLGLMPSYSLLLKKVEQNEGKRLPELPFESFLEEVLSVLAAEKQFANYISLQVLREAWIAYDSTARLGGVRVEPGGSIGLKHLGDGGKLVIDVNTLPDSAVGSEDALFNERHESDMEQIISIRDDVLREVRDRLLKFTLRDEERGGEMKPRPKRKSGDVTFSGEQIEAIMIILASQFDIENNFQFSLIDAVRQQFPEISESEYNSPKCRIPGLKNTVYNYMRIASNLFYERVEAVNPLFDRKLFQHLRRHKQPSMRMEKKGGNSGA